MRLLGPWVGLCLALAACELPRPEGAFNEIEASVPDAGSVAASVGRADAMVATAPPIPGGGAQPGMQGGAQGGIAGGTPGGGSADGGGPGGASSDAGVALSPEELALRKLEGRYLMRMDMYSTASATSGLITINTSNLVSHLIAAQLYVENGQLKGFEQLCYQTYAHKCTKGCTGLTTKMSPVMTDWFVKAKQIVRNYVLSNGMLEGRANTLALGFDATMNPSLPTVEDLRVWDPVPGGKREGLLLALDLAAIKNVRCDVYTTQIFVSKIIATKLPGTLDAPSLPATLKFGLNTDGSDGATLGTSNTECASGEGPPPTEGDQHVRFAPVAPSEFGGAESAQFWNCPPQDVWDQRLPATPP
jgi:hypothetical protein